MPKDSWNNIQKMATGLQRATTALNRLHRFTFDFTRYHDIANRLNRINGLSYDLMRIHDITNRLNRSNGLMGTHDIANRLNRINEAIRLTMEPTLGLIAAWNRNDVATLTINNDCGILTWLRERNLDDLDSQDYESTEVPPFSIAALQPGKAIDDSHQQLTVMVDVRCSRCGGNLLVKGSTYTVDSSAQVDLDLTVVPWCRCLSDWDGTVEDLHREDEKQTTPLKLYKGDELGDGEPTGELRLVSDWGAQGDDDDE